MCIRYISDDIVYVIVVAIVKDRFVHHTSFLYKFSNENMQYLQVSKLMRLLLSRNIVVYIVCELLFIVLQCFYYRCQRKSQSIEVIEATQIF